MVPKDKVVLVLAWDVAVVLVCSGVRGVVTGAERILRGQGGAGQGELGPTQQQQLLGQSFGVILLRACQHLNGPQKKRWGYNPPRPPSNSCI